jgi:hypothetical protein
VPAKTARDAGESEGRKMKSVLPKLVRIMWVPVLLSTLYTVSVFWQRHTANPVPKNPPYPLAAYGNSVKILQFYTGAREIAPDQKALVCYGVVNATAVRLDPPVERVWPAVSRCFEVAPARSTRYTLTAEGPEHTTVSESIEIAVKRK